jgi:protein-disulfide isomerase
MRLDVVASVVVIVCALTVTAVAVRLAWAVPAASPSTRPRLSEPLPKEPLSLTGAAVQGSADAKVALVEYYDYQCPACGQFTRDVLPRIVKDFVDTGKVLLAFRQFPLEGLHPLALGAATAAECAATQGRFREMHELLIRDPQHLDRSSLVDDARRLGLGVQDFESCMNTAGVERVKRSLTEGSALGIHGTPTVMLGMLLPDGQVRVTQRFHGAPKTDDLVSGLDAAIAAIR